MQKCKKLLMKGEVRFIEIKCPKCGYIQTVGTREVKAMKTTYP